MQNLLFVGPYDRDDVGEAAIAYQWAHRLGRLYKITVLTYRKRDSPQAFDQLPGLRVVEWREPPLLGRAERLNSMLKPAYVPFYMRARRWIRAAIARGEHFDVAYQPVPVAMRYPSPIAGLGVPYVIGPVGGSLDSPPGFDDEGSAPWFVRMRALDAFRLRHDPLLRRTFESADCVLGIAPYVDQLLSGVGVRRFEVMTDSGIDELPVAVARPHHPGPLRLLFVGRLVPTKGLRDLIRAMAATRDLPVSLDILGQGFDLGYCQNLVTDLGLKERVRFHGQRPRNEVDKFYADADIFVFPSYREAGGIVVTEAMSHGLPLIVADRGGPASTVDESCGIRVPVTTPGEYSTAIGHAIRMLVQRPELRAELGAAARDRVMTVAHWDAKLERLCGILDDIAAPLRNNG